MDSTPTTQREGVEGRAAAEEAVGDDTCPRNSSPEHQLFESLYEPEIRVYSYFFLLTLIHI